MLKKSIIELVPNFYNHVTGLGVAEMASFKAELFVNGQKSIYSHHVIGDSIYDKVYWV